MLVIRITVPTTAAEAVIVIVIAVTCVIVQTNRRILAHISSAISKEQYFRGELS